MENGYENESETEPTDESDAETMPDLEERVEEEDDDDGNEAQGDEDENFPLYREDDDDDDADSPLAVVEQQEYPSEDDSRDEEENEAQIEKEGEVDGTPNIGVPPSDLRLSQQDEMSALSGFDEANTPRRTERKFHTVTKTGRKCYTPKHLQKDHAMIVMSNPYALLGEMSPTTKTKRTTMRLLP